jgi:preprotein translocase subunit SecF
MINIVNRRYWFFGLSLLVIVPGMLALLVWGFPLAIDFTGGSLLEVRFDSGVAPQPAQVAAVYDSLQIGDPQVQSVGTDSIIVRSKAIDETTEAQILKELQTRFGGTVTVISFESVGPSVGAEVASRAAGAVGLATVGILIFITIAFRGVTHAFRYGVAAIITSWAGKWIRFS